MPGSGTDKTKTWVAAPGPIVILVEPQLGENIGTTARAMANFGLSRLRLVKPRDGWPNPRAYVAASGADRILDEALLFDTVEAAISDCTYVLATTARAHDQAKPVLGPEEAARAMAPRIAAGEAVGVVFGRERYGLENTEVALTDAIVTYPVNPAFASLNLAQAVLVIAYEWFKLVTAGALPFAMPLKSDPATKEQLLAFFENVERDGKNVVLHFNPRPAQTMLVACLYSEWTNPAGGKLTSFAAVTDEPPKEIAAAGHDRCIVNLKRENVEAWLSPQGRSIDDLQAILSDRQAPYYEHRVEEAA